MKRTLLFAFFLMCGISPGLSSVSAAEKIIKALDQDGQLFWQPKNTRAVIGDEIQWQIGVGDHGLRITNWSEVKDHLEVVSDPDHQEFSVTGDLAGENPQSTADPDKVLLRSKIKASFPPGGKIEFECIVHGGGENGMEGTVTVAAAPPGPTSLVGRLDLTQAMMVPSSTGDYVLVAPSLITKGRLIGLPVEMFESPDDLEATETAFAGVTVKSLTGPLRWEKNAEQVEVGKEIQWINGGGPHGLRITNWNDVRDSIEVVEAHGSPKNFKNTGKTPSSSEVNKVYALLKINSIPPATDTIEYNCVIHGNRMTGTVKIVPAAEPPADESHAAER